MKHIDILQRQNKTLVWYHIDRQHTRAYSWMPFYVILINSNDVLVHIFLKIIVYGKVQFKIIVRCQYVDLKQFAMKLVPSKRNYINSEGGHTQTWCIVPFWCHATINSICPISEKWIFYGKCKRFLSCLNFASPHIIRLYLLFLNALSPRQYGRHFPYDIFKCIFVNEYMWVSIKIWLKFVPKGQVKVFQHWFR